jgi:hypothetical protein
MIMEATMTVKARDTLCLWASAGLVLAPSGAASRPQSLPAHEARIGACIRQASGGRAWLEKTLWGLRDQEGGWIGAEVPNSNSSHDLGPLQVNSFWVPRLAALTHQSPERVRDWLINKPCFNVQAGRWIFLSALTATGDYWKAIGVYHSPTGWRQARYSASVMGHLRRRFGVKLFEN